MFLAYLPRGVEYCETDFQFNESRSMNKPAHAEVYGSSLLRFENMCIFVKGCLTFERVYSVPWCRSLMHVLIKHSMWLSWSPEINEVLKNNVMLHNFVQCSCKNIEQKCFIYHQMYHTFGGKWSTFVQYFYMSIVQNYATWRCFLILH